MKLTDFIPGAEQLKLIQGIEERLLRRKRVENTSLIIAVFITVFTLLLDALTSKKYSIEVIIQYLNNFTKFVWYILIGESAVAFRQYKPVYELSGLFIALTFFAFYLLLKRTQILFKYSEEPFRYTFWIEPFKHVRDTEKEPYKIGAEDRFHNLLHHDLMERLNERIKRLSLLNPEKLDDAGKKNLSSHIHIAGHYTIREARKDEWVVHVMPRLRIGPSVRPETLANPIKYTLDNCETLCTLERLDADQYNHLIERIYSGIATEIYRQIKIDLREKTDLFPTKYLKAIALYHEAEDFARSNTIDAYDHAIELYKESRRHFDIVNVTPITKCLLRLPFLLWSKEISFQHMMSRVELGYAKCLIYRRQISALSGRPKNPLFEIRKRLDNVINNLLLINSGIEKSRPSVSRGKITSNDE
ncbi:MAG TPA: hypothetical protein VMT12_17420, partial [Syntrophales bacterium]|nr:hypothetical protein [Syntrophales bacterium]